MFYVMDKEELILFDDNLAQLETTRGFMPQLTEETRETDIVTADELRQYPNKVIAVPNEYEVEVQDYESVKQEQEVPIYDDNGEITGYEIVEVDVLLPSGTHLETRVYYTLALNPNFEDEEAQKEAERIGKLTCTKRVFALMLQELGITYTQLKTLIASNEQAELEWDLCVELERKNPLLDIMAGTLGITPIQLDGLFMYANGEITIEQFRELIPKPDVNNSETVEEETPVTDEVLNVEDVNNLEDEVNNE